jgi:hypothetical protein
VKKVEHFQRGFVSLHSMAAQLMKHPLHSTPCTLDAFSAEVSPTKDGEITLLFFRIQQFKQRSNPHQKICISATAMKGVMWWSNQHC